MSESFFSVDCDTGPGWPPGSQAPSYLHQFPDIKRRKRGEMFCGTLGGSWMVLYILKIVAASRGFYPQILSEIQKVKQLFISDEIPSPSRD